MKNEFIKKTFRFDRESEKTIKKILENENKINNELGRKRTTENQIMMDALGFYYEEKYDWERIRKENDRDALYYASITNKLVGKYFNSILDSLEILAGEVGDTKMHLKIFMERKDIFDEIDWSNLKRIVSAIRSDETVYKKIKSLYDSSEKREENKQENNNKEENNDEDERYFF